MNLYTVVYYRDDPKESKKQVEYVEHFVAKNINVIWDYINSEGSYQDVTIKTTKWECSIFKILDTKED